MTNYEMYKEELLDILADNIGVDKETEIPFDCSDSEYSCSKCKKCMFFDKGCYNRTRGWLDAEYVEPSVDWRKVEKDTKILVKHCENDKWERRYFAKFDNGHVYAYPEGTTSWTSSLAGVRWEYAKLVKEGQNE